MVVARCSKRVVSSRAQRGIYADDHGFLAALGMTLLSVKQLAPDTAQSSG